MLFSLLLATLFSGLAMAQQKDRALPDSSRPVLLVDAACGQCQFKLKGKGCDLAVRMDGKAYFVDGTHLDEHGDAHASDGFCNKIRKARVQGEVVKGRFKARYFQLLPDADPKSKE